MDNPRPEKVAVVDEVRGRFGESNAAILTEYRGLKVKDLAGLRRSLRPSGGEYKIYKNTLVRLAAQGSGLDALEEMLVGPTGIAFVDGDAAAVAKVSATSPGPTRCWSSRAACSARRSSGPRRLRRWPTCRPGRSCWRSSPGPWPLRCSSWPGSCRPCPGTWPTAWRPSATREPRTRASTRRRRRAGRPASRRPGPSRPGTGRPGPG